ncbi:MAG: aminomethyl-transferring glycine dehydrogenase subunit GcvPA [Pseudomonadota bacterium]
MRYLPLTDIDRAHMLREIGAPSVDALFEDAPRELLNPDLGLPPAASEIEVERALSALARKNRAGGDGPFFIGCGAYRHHVPASVDHIIQRSEFLTTYTPYQPEIAQGTLQYLFEFQTQVALLTGMDVANASMYDGSTACGEAALMAQRVTKRRRLVVAGGLHPHYKAVLGTLCADGPDAANIVTGAGGPGALGELGALIDEETACVIVQSPDVFGMIHDVSALAEAAHAQGALLIFVFTEAMSLGLLTSPGSMGADIVVGEGQSIGNALNFGGPYVGLFATRTKYVRQSPGRLAGETVDADGKRGYVLTLSTREQHIRRDKATSNICTNSGLCALAFTIHLTLLGEAGLTELAEANHARACQLADRLTAVQGVSLETPRFFNELTLRLPRPADDVAAALTARGVLGGVPGGRLWPNDPAARDLLIVAATELNTDEDIAAYGAALEEALQA